MSYYLTFTEGTSLKILFEKMLLSKKPKGPQKSTMTVGIVDLMELPDKLPAITKPKSVYYVRSCEKQFNINKALRASPDEIKQMSKEQINSRIKKYVFGNLGIINSQRQVRLRTTSLDEAKKKFTELCKKIAK